MTYYAHSKEGQLPEKWQTLEKHLNNVAELTSKKKESLLPKDYIAHGEQRLSEHLQNVAKFAKIYAEKIGMGNFGEILGLLHDFGKYSSEFQKYIKDSIKSNNPQFNPDEDEDYEDTSGRKGKIDHSTAGAQYLSNNLVSSNAHKILCQILSLCLVSHHSGLMNCLTTDNTGTWDSYSKRLTKNDALTHREECSRNSDKSVLERIDQLLSDKSLTKPFEEICRQIVKNSPEKTPMSTIAQFQVGLLVRFLFSVLIDADRQDSADSENPVAARYRQQGNYISWDILIERLKNKYKTFEVKNRVDEIRKEISDNCLKSSEKLKGLFTLTVPTGGGKTLASLRFALHHAKKHEHERIIYIVPFTSIIDQNAQVVREILESEKEDHGRIVLEHHSNIGADVQSWKEKILTENWDAPIVFTTMVQFLEALFGAGTRGARRMHQLAKSVIVFDEIQTLPIKCVHIFNNAINFLVDYCSSTIVLCTATQPLLGTVNNTKGALKLSASNELIPNIEKLFDDLKRVKVHDRRKPFPGWTFKEIAGLAVNQVLDKGSCLVVANTKKSARAIYEEIGKENFNVFHLSTGMCPAHRKKVLNIIRQKLGKKPVLCVSTQLIEAGVDVDFRSVIRMLAGLDSIAQAAGRCNRHGFQSIGDVFIVNSKEENVGLLKDIEAGELSSLRVLSDYRENPAKYDNDIIGPKMLKWYYENYFYNRKNDMDYRVNTFCDDTLLNMLSKNELAVADYLKGNKEGKTIPFIRQAFMSATKEFKAIDAPTYSVIVRYDEEGRDLVNQLCSVFEVEKQFTLIKKAQQYSVNLFKHEFEKLSNQSALQPVQQDTEIFYLDNQYYSKITGISLEPVKEEEQFHESYYS